MEEKLVQKNCKKRKIYMDFNLLNKSVLMLDANNYPPREVKKYIETLRSTTGSDIFVKSTWIKKSLFQKYIKDKRKLLTCDNNLQQFYRETMINNRAEYNKYMELRKSTGSLNTESNENLS